MAKRIYLIVCGIILFMSCDTEENEPNTLDPSISLTSNSKEYLPKDTAVLSFNVSAPGKIKDIFIGQQHISSFTDEVTADGTTKYVIPENTSPGDYKIFAIVADQQVPSKTDTAEILLKIRNVTLPAIAPTVCDYDFNESILTSSGWTKHFEDNFSADLSKWTIWNGGAFNNELQLYTPDNLGVIDGELVITVKKETVTGPDKPYDPTPKSYDYTSGRIECKTNISANANTPKVKIMARIKWPNKYGLWPGFWSYGDPWPTQGELNIFEARGQNPTQFQTNYSYGTSAGTDLAEGGEKVITSDKALTSCYHIYEVIWEKDKLTYLLDGVVVDVKTGSYIESMFGKTQRIVVKMAVGGAFFSDLDPSKIETGSMLVDYVKVFTSK